MDKSYLIIYQTKDKSMEDVFKENGINKYMILNDQLASIYVPENYKETKLNEINEVAYWELSNPMSSLIEITNNVKDGENITDAAGTDYIYKNPYITALGKNVMIAILDSGIDYLHPDFINNDGTSKIISIWDQDASKGDSQHDYLFGREITRDQINKAIKEKDATLTKDNVGTGTMAAGICCGMGNLNEAYKGVAVESELIVVKLKEYKNTYMDGVINYQSADFLAGIKYVIDVAKKEKKYLVINLTVSNRTVESADITLLDSFDYLSKAGVIVVGGAGNEGNTDIHYEGKINNLSISQDITVQVGELQNLSILLCPSGPDKISTELISPGGEISYSVEYSPEYYVYKGKFNIEGTSYEMRYVYPLFETGNQLLYIYLKNVKPGIWTIRVHPEFIINGDFNIYLPNKNLISKDTRFIDPTSTSTISIYALTRNVITIGAYNDKTDAIWIGSSKGPVNINGIKPDIVAPGVDIIAPFINNTYNTGTGTGISSSIISGVVAIIMDYITSQSEYNENSLFTEIIKTYLMLGATKKEIYTYPNISQGYGILNLKETIIQIAANLEE